MKPVVLSGITTKFEGYGRRLGYPTANLAIATDLKDGVYFGHASLGDIKDQPAMIFIGTPTTMSQTGRRIEAHILDIPDQDYYNLPLRLSVEYFHRPNQTFDTMEALIQIMKNDETAAREWFA